MVLLQNTCKSAPLRPGADCHRGSSRKPTGAIAWHVNKRKGISSCIRFQDGKIEKNFNQLAIGGRMHYILKCDRLLRKWIFKYHDKVNLDWEVYTVRD